MNNHHTMLTHQRRHHPVLIRLALVILTLLAHGRVLSHGFVLMDDPQTIYENPRLKPPSLANTVYYWKNRGLELYIPLTYSAWSLTAVFSADRQAGDYPLHAVGFHLANLSCHLLSVLLVLEILLTLQLSTESAWLGAALFAVHPLQVEAIAWATGLKDVLSGAAALLAIWQYLLAISVVKPTQIKVLHYAVAFAGFCLSVLAKPAGVAALGIIIVLDWFLVRTPPTRLLVRLSPWLAVSVAIAIIAHFVQPGGEVLDNSLALRPLIALDAIWFYLAKLCWPIQLCLDYARRPTFVIDQGFIKWTWIVPVILGAVIWSIRRRERLVAAAAGIWIAGLLPTLGLIPFIYQRHSTVADRYTYLAALGPAMLMAWFARKYSSLRFPAIAIIAAMTLLTVRQESYWTDSQHLFAHAIEVNPEAPFSHLNYGVALANAGNVEEAANQFRQTLALAPQNSLARDNLSIAERLIATHSRKTP